MGEAVVEYLTPARLDAYWPSISDAMDQVPHIWDQWWTKECIYDGGLEGIFQFWAVGDDKQIQSIVITKVVEYPAGKIVQSVFAFGHDMDEAIPQLDAIMTRFARSVGARALEVIGREGWVRKLKPLGFVQQSVTMHKTLLTNGVH